MLRVLLLAGKLDVQGQVMVKAMRSYMGADQGAMYSRIAELDDIIAGDNEGAAVMAAAEKAGVETALLYHDRVRSLAERERGIREELRDHANRWSPKLSGDERQVYLEQKRELEESLRKARIDRAESLREIAGRVGGMVAESIDRLKAYKESEKARIEEIHHNANSDMEGRPFEAVAA